MDSDILFYILFALLVLPLSLFSKFKKTLAEQGDASLDPASDDPFGEEDEEFMEDEPEEEVSPYFTYEAEEVPVQPVAPRTEKPRVRVAVPAAEPVAQPRFDLRQAVVSQIVLENKYIDELNQQK